MRAPKKAVSVELVLLALGGGGVLVASLRARAHLQHARLEKRRAETELSAITHLAEADAVLFGEELGRLDARVADAELDADVRADYQSALESYETALRIVDRLESADDVSKVVDSLAAGRYAAACVLARLEGAPLPAFRVPCFFDPRHGPAATEVVWNVPRKGTRKVPACAMDAARKAEGQQLDVTMVRINGYEVPYWAAGALNRPYGNGPASPRLQQATDQVRAYHETYNQSEGFGPY